MNKTNIFANNRLYSEIKQKFLKSKIHQWFERQWYLWYEQYKHLILNIIRTTDTGIILRKLISR